MGKKISSEKRQEVLNAIEALVSSGHTPSLRAIRDHLGKGSFATIQPILKDWTDKQREIEMREQAPPEIIEHVSNNTHVIWKRAQKIALAKYANAQRKLNDAVNALKHENDQLRQKIFLLEDRNLQLAIENRKLRKGE